MPHGTGTTDRQRLIDASGDAIDAAGASTSRALSVSDRELLQALKDNTAVMAEIRDLLLKWR